MDVSKICSDLVKIKSENPPGITKGVAEYIYNFMESVGVPSELIECPNGHTNVISKDQSKKLLLAGHIDVVPAIDEGWDIPPFSGKIDETFVHGRGSTDMKGGCSSILAAVEKIAGSGEELPSLAFVCDEEGGGKYGMRHLLDKKLIHQCDCLIAEPTPAKAPCIGQKGVCRFDVEFNGEPGHSSLYPVLGISAVTQAMDFIHCVDKIHERVYNVPEIDRIIENSIDVSNELYGADLTPVFKHIMYNPGIISGGERVNIVAQKCSLSMDMRLPWGADCDNIINEIRGVLPKSAKLNVLTEANASITTPDSFLVKTTCDAVGRVYKIESKPMVQWAASDARALRIAGFNAIEYGPGELDCMHGLNERVRRTQLENCVEIYENVIRSYNGAE
ncbi:MAG: ArgE/DapE family deacylase [Methanocorpusculum sp.]|nr:ArgE/DapE family deacylase [Methanocorpusculum sp.]